MGHLDETGVTYWQHWKFAMQFAVVLFLASLCVLVHAFCPFWFKTTGPDAIRIMSEVLNEEDSDASV